MLRLMKEQCNYDWKYKKKLDGNLNCNTNEGYPFFSSKQNLIQRLREIPSDRDTVSVFHEYFWKDSPANYIWMNMMRDPVANLVSAYYYKTDIDAYGYRNAKHEVRKRANDGCGCAYLEFNDCIRRNMGNPKCNDYMRFYPQSKHFIDDDENHSLANAYDNIVNKFTAVGISEFYSESILLYEKTIPQIFAGVYDAHFSTNKTRKSNKSVQFNTLTNTSMNGAVASDVREHLKLFSEENILEVNLYKMVVRHFWRQYAALIPTSRDIEE